MSLLKKLSRRWRSCRLARLIKKSRPLAEAIYARTAAETTQIKARQLTQTEEQSIKWADRRWLVDAQLRAEKQIILIDRCLTFVDRIRERRPGKHALSSFIDNFSNLFDGTTDNKNKLPTRINELRLELTKTRRIWRTVRATRTAKTNVFVTQTLVRLSELSNVQLGSLVTGLLILLGAVQMIFYYQAAVSQPISVYWTFNDLMIQGVSVMPWIVVVLFLVEVSNIVLGFRDWLAPRILRRPVVTASILLLGLIVLASCVGYWKGSNTFNDFKYTGGREMVTVLNNTTLDKVHLVGTTTRTAVFLIATGTESLRNARSPNFYETLLLAFDEITTSSSTSQSLNTPSERRGYEVILMDRGQIACQAMIGKGNVCETFRDSDVDMNNLSDIDERMKNHITTIQMRIDGVEDTVTGLVKRKVAGVETHMDRHHDQITNLLNQGS